MAQDELMPIIREQTEILYANLEVILKTVKESELHDQNICDWPLGEQVYHLLHSLDQWFINPTQYVESPLALQKSEANAKLSSTDLVEYYNSVKTKISKYLESLDVGSLSQRPTDCRFSRLALILGQYRHFMYHIGLIHGCLRMHTGGNSPEYFGLGPPIKTR